MQTERQLISLRDLAKVLEKLCKEGKVGTIFITTQDKRSAGFVIKDNMIVGVAYKGLYGIEALQLIKDIQSCTFSFLSNNLSLLRQMEISHNKSPTPPTTEIFRLLTSSSATLAVQHEQPVQPKKKILIVEDSNTTRKIIDRILTEGGYATAEAANGMEALAEMSHNKPDLILLDIVMPGMDGYKVLSLIRKSEDSKDIPVILLTSRDQLFDKIRGKMSSADHYLTKPFKPPELLEVVARYLKQ
jgi:CheY-like chemotaxis protein